MRLPAGSENTGTMPQSRLKIWAVATIFLGIVASIIRAVWQIVVIPTFGTMLIFIPVILAALLIFALFVYLVMHPRTIMTRPFRWGVTVAISAGLLAALTHYVRFIVSPVAEPFWSKVIGTLLTLCGCSAYGLIVYLVWRRRSGGQPEV